MLRRLAAPLLAATLLAGCSSLRPWINEPLRDEALTPVPRQTTALMANPDSHDLSMIVAVTLSGGGARAAAFGYGVLDAMRQTRFRWNGRDTSLIDELDVISGVSGGSIIAAYFAAFGPETFPRFEDEFLRMNFQDTLVSQMIKPGNLVDLSSPWFGRTHLLQRTLDDLYKGKTFGDLYSRPGQPRLLISATDLSLGSAFEFSWEQFERICSDLSSVPLSFAVAASSAVPIVLSPMTLKNYAGECRRAALVPVGAPGDDYRVRQMQLQSRSYLDAANRPYIHLVDGGLADNLGVRGLLDRSLASGGIRGATRELPKKTVRKLVLITVNSERDPSERIDASDRVPNTLQVVDALLFGAGARATQETLGMLKDVAAQWKRELRGSGKPGDDAFTDDAQIHVITVNLRDAPQAMEPRTLLQVPTAFTIPAYDVARLVEAGRQVLRDAPEFQELLRSLDVQKPEP